MLKSLEGKISENFPNHNRTCVRNVLLLTLCVIHGKTTNLHKLRSRVSMFTGKATTAQSGYKRLIRVFDRYAFSRLWLDLLLYSFKLLRLKSDCLILDGTSWEWQGVERHYLTLSILYRGVAVPIYWVDLGRLGASGTKVRKRMFRRVFKLFDLKGKVLLADREYLGEEWFKYLVDNGLDFIIRLRCKAYKKQVDAAPGRTYQEMADKVLRSKLPGKAVSKRVVISGMELTFVVMKNPDPDAKKGDRVIFLLSTWDKPAAAIAAYYRRRWGIECCFKHLKSNGFKLEMTNLRGKARPKLLTAVVVFAYVLSIHEGLKTYHKVRTGQRADGRLYKTESVFRHGLDNLLSKIPSMRDLCRYITLEVSRATRAYRSAKWVIV